MAAMVPLRDALQRLVNLAQPLPPRETALLDCDGLVLVEDCVARRTQPPFAVSAMDGYALAAAPQPGQCYDVIGEAPAGGEYAGIVGPGQAVRIFTGAPIPKGSTHVLIQEDANRDGDSIQVSDTPGAGSNIRPQGGDFREGDILIKAGTKLAPQHVALAASGNHTQLLVQPPPSIAILMTGDELVLPGPDVAASNIIASNGFGLATLSKRFGVRDADVGLLPDDQEKIEDYLNNCEADLILTVGGASVGDHDLVRPALEAAGFALDVPKVALRPGKPTFFGTRGQQFVLGLPGNPVSSLVSALVFLRPLIARVMAQPVENLLPLQKATLGADVPTNGPRDHFMRAFRGKDGRVSPVNNQDSSLLNLLSQASVLIHRPAHEPASAKGEPCNILLLPS